MNLLQHFPSRLGTPRDQQVQGLNFLSKSDKAFSILEMTVGSGKSGVAVGSCAGYGSSYLVTPTKSLQNQYSEDFRGDSVQLRGRANYHCSHNKPELNRKIIHLIKQGQSFPMPNKYESCGAAPCIPLRNGKRKAFIEECESGSGPCPYTTMIEECQKHDLVIANPYSLIYISYFGGHLSQRELLVVDEAHDLIKVIRSIATLNITINRLVAPKEIEGLVTPSHWINWLKRAEQQSTFPDKKELEKYLAKLEKLEKSESAYGKKAIVKCFHDSDNDKFKVTFIPDNIAGLARELLFNLGKKVILLSGTIPDYRGFCMELGIPLDDVDVLRIPSDFPAQNRPVYLPQTQLDLSHKNWMKNLAPACKEVDRIIALYSNKRTIVHTPSYRKAHQVAELLKSPKVITHEPENFQEKLDIFLKTEGAVFVSPSVAQGVSFDGTKAENQIIMTPSYANIDDPLVKYRLDQGLWNWYNTQALIVFLQQCGRVVRSKDETGHTWLIDIRFNDLIRKCWKQVPQWFADGLK